MSEEFSVADKVNAILSPMYKRRQEQAEECLKEITAIVSGHAQSDEKVAQISLLLIDHYSKKSN